MALTAAGHCRRAAFRPFRGSDRVEARPGRERRGRGTSPWGWRRRGVAGMRLSAARAADYELVLADGVEETCACVLEQRERCAGFL